MAERINVLMCGGRRTGKTSIMAAMQDNMQSLISDGSVRLTLQNNAELVLYQAAQKKLFSADSMGEVSYYASDKPSDDKSEYRCDITLKNGYESPIGLNFIDIPGEWFLDQQDRVEELIRDSQILVIAVDCPHLIEDSSSRQKKPGDILGPYHEVFNRPQQISDLILKAFQGTDLYRLVLFVPVKCELYRNNGTVGREKDMEYVLKAVKEGYHGLLENIKTSYRDKCAIAVSPCITMGGLEFMQFVPPMDDSGAYILDAAGCPLEDIGKDPETGYPTMHWWTEYNYLFDQNGLHYYAPENCAQPLLYILLFFVAVGKLRKKRGLFGTLIDAVERALGVFLNKLPKQQLLDNCKSSLLARINTDATDGFAILHDPIHMM